MSREARPGVGKGSILQSVIKQCNRKEIRVTSCQSYMKLFWLVDRFFATQLNTSYPHHTQVTLFLHHHVMCHISKLTNSLLLPLQLVSQHLRCVMFPSSPTCFLPSSGR